MWNDAWSKLRQPLIPVSAKRPRPGQIALLRPEGAELQLNEAVRLWPMKDLTRLPNLQRQQSPQLRTTEQKVNESGHSPDIATAWLKVSTWSFEPQGLEYQPKANGNYLAIIKFIFKDTVMAKQAHLEIRTVAVRANFVTSRIVMEANVLDLQTLLHFLS